MEEIKVGEYVRTIDGYIRKITQVNKKGSYEGLCYGAYSVDKKYKNSVGISAKKIINHSKNILDLIEVGDYVNGYEVLDKYYFAGQELVLETSGEDTNCKCLMNKDIKSIVTKEQFKSVEYVIEEDK